jgi:hypothetical protein
MTKDHHKKERWEGELINRQRNIVFPDTVRNDRLVNELLWKGSPNATPVQRIGIAVLSIGPFCVAAQFIGIGWDALPDAAAILAFLVALPFVYVGCRLVRNAFFHRPKSDKR